jgi:hypothetical protein
MKHGTHLRGFRFIGATVRGLKKALIDPAVLFGAGVGMMKMGFELLDANHKTLVARVDALETVHEAQGIVAKSADTERALDVDALEPAGAVRCAYSDVLGDHELGSNEECSGCISWRKFTSTDTPPDEFEGRSDDPDASNPTE